MGKFQKGQSGNPAGRPEGSKNKNYTNVGEWLERLWGVIDDLPVEKQEETCKWAIDRLLAKINNLPGTQGDSVDNARRLLGGIEPPPVMPPGVQALDPSGVNGK